VVAANEFVRQPKCGQYFRRTAGEGGVRTPGVIATPPELAAATAFHVLD
ncbi:MAG: hypothetical protein QOH82_352, partial [Mycobacterium sp.]|nr:hypothetical protein [Mycobacterium sp.]